MMAKGNTLEAGGEVGAPPSCEAEWKPRYIKAHVCGGLSFACPYCGKWQRQRIDYTSSFVYCHNRLCKRKLELSFWLAGVKPNRFALPSREPPEPLGERVDLRDFVR